MILVADIGGTKIAAARADPSGRICSPIIETPTPATAGASSVVTATLTLLRELRQRGDEVVGISTAGVVDDVEGAILAATGSIHGWAGTPLATLLRNELGLPTWILGDGNAFGLGLAAQLSVDNLVVLIVGTGVGGSLIIEGAPMMGAHHAGGHFGHIVSPQAAGLLCPCGKIGHLEAVASGHGILAWYRANGGDPQVGSTLELTRRTDDNVAHAALSTGGAALGAAAGALINALDPDLAAVCGSVTRAGDMWQSSLRTAYAEALMPALDQTPLVIAAQGPETALQGAARYGLRRMNP